MSLSETYFKPDIGSNVFLPERDIPSLSGKTYIVTGASAGIGFGIAGHLLSKNPAKIYALSNKQEHIDQARTAIEAYGDASKIEWVQCDLASLKQTDQVAKDLAKKIDKLDGLICNAGIGVGKYWETEDGLDSHFQINYLSQAHLAFILLPILQKTQGSRLIFQASSLHQAAPSDVKFESVEEINQDIGAAYLYNRVKLAEILFVHAMYRRKQQNQLGFVSTGSAPYPNIIATHPGAVSTDQQEQMVEAYGPLAKPLVALIRPTMKDPESQGCRSALYAATSPEIIEKNLDGVYIVPDKMVDEPTKQSQDVQLQENLWKLTREILQSKLGSLPYDM